MKKKMLKEIFDTPYHIGYLKMDENDSRRDKRRCVHFDRIEGCKSYCKKNFCRCPGSSHCKFYCEDMEKYIEEINDINRQIREKRLQTRSSNSKQETNNIKKETSTSAKTIEKTENNFLFEEINVLKDIELFDIVMKYLYKKGINYAYFSIYNKVKKEPPSHIKCIVPRGNVKIKLISETDYKNFVKINDINNLYVKFNFRDEDYKKEIVELINKM